MAAAGVGAVFAGVVAGEAGREEVAHGSRGMGGVGGG